MRPNLATWDRLLRVLIGLGMMSIGWLAPGAALWSAALKALGFFPLIGPELAHYLSAFDVVIVVDTVLTEDPPGHLAALHRDDILGAGPSIRVSPHDPGLREALLTAELEGQGPTDVVLIGVVPASVDLGTRIGAEVKSALPRIQDAVLEELRRIGITPEVRVSPAPPDIWWER